MSTNWKQLGGKNGEGRTALSLAAENRFHKVLGRLLEKGADTDTSDDSLMTPLHYACILPCFETVVIKNLQCRGTAKVRLSSAKPPQLLLARVQQSVATLPAERGVGLILKYSAERKHMNNRHLSALDLAILDGLDSAVALLRKSPAWGTLGPGLDDGRPRASQTLGDDVEDLEGRQRSDYTKLLLAMPNRRARFRLDYVQT